MRRADKIFTGVMISFGVILVVAFAFVFFVLIPRSELAHRPELSEHVEVTGKRIRIGGSSSKYGVITSYTYIVAFEFPNGLVKELEVDFVSIDGNPKEEPYSDIYESLHEGETGILTYKEAENLEQSKEKEEDRYQFRQFISFQKDN